MTRPQPGIESEALRFAVGASSLGGILVASCAAGITAILLGDGPVTLARDLQRRFPAARLTRGDDCAMVAIVVDAVELPRAGVERLHSLPLDVRGTLFQRRVWQVLRAIPVGETLSYREVAVRIGAPGSVRAVAGACAANRLAIAIPCHRVVRGDGALSGYAWGIDRKHALLDRERAA